MKSVLNSFRVPPPPPKYASSSPPSVSRTSSSSAPLPTTSKPFTVLELFQSQGCSSCPPTAAQAAALADDPETLLLTYAVTYWDKLGWTDTFGDVRWTERQYEYTRKLGGNKNAYTPQVVVNGRGEGVGATADALQAIIADSVPAAPQAPLAVSIRKGVVTVAGAPRGSCTVRAVYYNRSPPDVRVQSGENAGKVLAHRNVVRDLRNIGIWTGGTEVFEIPRPVHECLDVAVLVQEGPGGPLLGAAWSLEGEVEGRVMRCPGDDKFAA